MVTNKTKVNCSFKWIEFCSFYLMLSHNLITDVHTNIDPFCDSSKLGHGSNFKAMSYFLCTNSN